MLELKFHILQIDIQLIPATRFSIRKDKYFGSFSHLGIYLARSAGDRCYDKNLEDCCQR
jgi:hypothetical protein